ncbi:MAG: ABC transporter ATP-binding protein [Bacteroidales bacterium]
MIELKNVGYQYKKGVNVLQGITLNFYPGKIYGILGKNGVGKSTLLKIICGLLQPEGECRVEEFIPFDRNALFLEKVTFIPETPVVPALSIEELGRITAPFYSTFDFDFFRKTLFEFEVPVAQSLQNLSLGQQKKALIALGLACKTDYLLMDEPTNGLDIPSKSTFRKLIAAQLEEDRTILISTHQVRDLENLIDSVVIIDNEGMLLNQSVNEIEKQLAFKVLAPGDRPLFVESSVRGNWGVIPRIDSDDLAEGNIDMELLFNAVNENKEQIKELFKNVR